MIGGRGPLKLDVFLDESGYESDDLAVVLVASLIEIRKSQESLYLLDQLGNMPLEQDFGILGIHRDTIGGSHTAKKLGLDDMKLALLGFAEQPDFFEHR